LRDGERVGARFEIVTPRQLVSAFADLINLHQERWVREGRPGVFAAWRFIEFHRGLADAWLPSGRAILARLFLDSEPIAVLYGFVTGSKFDFYQSGIQIDPAGPLRSPGTLAHLLLMKALSERGVTTYDFLRGSSEYKKRLATGENQLATIELWRPTPRVATWRAAHSFARLTSAGVRFVRRAGHPPASRVQVP
jgi:CelD/BcsL family acetyltransferase involved in cellulose biosynthesis